MHDPRQCPICDTPFIPRQINSVGCSPKCARRVLSLRSFGCDYDRGKQDILIATLEAVLKVREADAVVQAIIDARDAEEDAQAAAKHRVDTDLIKKQDAEWYARFRDLDAQRKASGWKPLTIGAAPPDQRRKTLIALPPRKRT